MNNPTFQLGFNMGRQEAIALLRELLAKGLREMELLAEFSTQLTEKAYPEIPEILASQD